MVGIAVFLVLMAVVAAVVAYPLLPGRGAVETASLTDADIERAVRGLRKRRRGRLHCPACGEAYDAGDRFCVHCGSDLAQAQAVEGHETCPSCGAELREGDVFCSKCGHRLVTKEDA